MRTFRARPTDPVLPPDAGKLCPRRGGSGPRLPHPAFNLDTEQARASVRKLAALEPAAAWPGHASPVTGDVRAQLERAAESA